MSIKKKCYAILATLLLVMLVLPTIAVRVSPPGSEMGLFVLLFFVVNPFTVIVISIIAGTAMRKLWWVPFLAAAVFPFFFAIVIVDFVWDMFVYSGIYLPIGLMAMLGTHIGIKLARKNSSDEVNPFC